MVAKAPSQQMQINGGGSTPAPHRSVEGSGVGGLLQMGTQRTLRCSNQTQMRTTPDPHYLQVWESAEQHSAGKHADSGIW